MEVRGATLDGADRDDEGGGDVSLATSVLTAAAEAAGHALSIHNTQPWRWRVGTTLVLYADRTRQLSVIDPDRHLLLLSCGAALHRALVALAANVGHPYLVLRLGHADPDHPGPPHTPRLPAEQVVEVIAK